jgi:hypothetical protein
MKNIPSGKNESPRFTLSLSKPENVVASGFRSFAVVLSCRLAGVEASADVAYLSSFTLSITYYIK